MLYLQSFTGQLSVGEINVLNINHDTQNGSAWYDLSWDFPFSLNLTGIEPDVVFLIEAYKLNTTCEESALLFSKFVYEPLFTVNRLHFPYQIVIIPRSNIAGARNGIRTTYSGNVFFVCVFYMYNCNRF